MTSRSAGMALERLVAVPVDVGKATAMAMVLDFTGRRLAAPFEFAMDRAGVALLVGRVAAAAPAGVQLVRVGVEACGHYHRPLVGPGVLPEAWQVLELNPAWVSAQRRVNGSARRKTDPVDLLAIADLLLAGRGYPAGGGDAELVELAAWRLITAAREALPTADAAVARHVLVADLALLADLDAQVAAADTRVAALVPATRYRVLTSVPGWGTVRVGAWAAAAGDPGRWPSHRQLYRAAGLPPVQYESAGRRRDGHISREGSVTLRRALLDLGVGLWHRDPAAAAYAATTPPTLIPQPTCASLRSGRPDQTPIQL